MVESRKSKSLTQSEGGSCFLSNCPCSDTVVNLGPDVMDSKDLDDEMRRGTELGLKLREIAKKVEKLV